MPYSSTGLRAWPLTGEIDAVDPNIRKELTRYVLRHASYYWTLGIDKSQVGWSDSYFSVKCTEPREAGTGGSLGAYTSAAQALEAMWIMKGTNKSESNHETHIVSLLGRRAGSGCNGLRFRRE